MKFRRVNRAWPAYGITVQLNGSDRWILIEWGLATYTTRRLNMFERGEMAEAFPLHPAATEPEEGDEK